MISQLPRYGMAALAGLLLLTTQGRADMVVTEGMKPWEICGLCHGLEGIPAVAKFPVLAGQDSAYLAKQLRDFRAGRRNNDGGQMEATVTEVQESDIEPIADYFSRQPLKRANPDVVSEDFVNGKFIFEQGEGPFPACIRCHGEDRSSYSAPTLYGQNPEYLIKQLRDFKSGARGNDANRLMMRVTENMTDEQMKKVSEYLRNSAP